MFIIGTGSVRALQPPMYSNSGNSAALAAALQVASETPRMALAPNAPLLGVPSRSIMTWSTSRWRVASRPTTSPAIFVLTFSTAFRTPLPP